MFHFKYVYYPVYKCWSDVSFKIHICICAVNIYIVWTLWITRLCDRLVELWKRHNTPSFDLTGTFPRTVDRSREDSKTVRFWEPFTVRLKWTLKAVDPEMKCFNPVALFPIICQWTLKIQSELVLMVLTHLKYLSQIERYSLCEFRRFFAFLSKQLLFLPTTS